jgi:manganese/zinc/iron transport system substrate-binding protein
MPKNRRHLSLLLVLLLPLLAGCEGDAGSRPRDPNQPLRIVATTGIIADTAKRIVGEHAQVEALMGPGVDPHLYKASESDVRRLAEADLILYNGLHLEGKMGDILTKMARTRAVVAVSEGISEDQLRQPPEFQGLHDPHVWFDVSLWARTLQPIVGELETLDPQHAEAYRANAAALEKELTELDGWVKQQIATIPPPQRVLITAHDAFGYFGGRYGMEVVGLQGISTLSEAGLKDMDRVIGIVAQRKIRSIFVESSVPRRSIEAVQAAVREQGGTVTIGGQLFSDSLGPANGPAGSYVGMVRANVETIVKALR